jgi:NAD(P)-dependent dehydrogenase (short-subunit alcohol dehydrogenase family)
MGVVLITGGLRGIGRELTREFLATGWSVLSLSRAGHPDSEAELRAGAPDGVWLRHLECDLADLAAVRAIVAQALADPAVTAAGGLAAVINNAATQGPVGTLSEIALDEWIECQTINLHAPVAICQVALPHLKARGGTIINFTGGGGAKAQHFFSAYSTSKAGIVRFTECLARECQEDAPNVACFVVTPGFVSTDIHQTTLDAGQSRAREFFDFVKSNLAKGGNSPEKVARFCRKLTDPTYAWMSGRFFSGAFDDVDDPALVDGLRADGDLFTLRRIDNFAFKRA